MVSARFFTEKQASVQRTPNLGIINPVGQLAICAIYGISYAAGLNELSDEIHWPRFWGIHMQLIVFLFLYNIVAVIAEEIGRERLTKLLLGKAGAIT